MKSALFIGRFQPFHNGHLETVKKILNEEKNDKIYLVIGSAEKNYLPKNPLTAAERFQLIDAALKEAEIPADRYRIIPIRNVNNYALWVNHVNVYVPPYDKIYTGSKIVKACYQDHNKEIVQIKTREFGISASTVRKAILQDEKWEDLVPKSVAKLLIKWKIFDRLTNIKDTMDVTKYNNSY